MSWRRGIVLSDVASFLFGVLEVRALLQLLLAATFFEWLGVSNRIVSDYSFWIPFYLFIFFSFRKAAMESDAAIASKAGIKDGESGPPRNV